MSDELPARLLDPGALPPRRGVGGDTAPAMYDANGTPDCAAWSARLHSISDRWSDPEPPSPRSDPGALAVVAVSRLWRPHPRTEPDLVPRLTTFGCP